MELHEELEEYRARIKDKALRAEIAAVLADWAEGVIPAPAKLRRLRERVLRDATCTRLAEDGSCLWLRRYGAAAGLAVPPRGVAARCPFLDARTFDRCPGFRRP